MRINIFDIGIQCNEFSNVIFLGEKLFYANKEVTLWKQFYTNVPFALTTFFYPLKIQVLTPILDKIL